MDFEKMLKRVDLNYLKNYILCGNPCFEEKRHESLEEEFEKDYYKSPETFSTQLLYTKKG